MEVSDDFDVSDFLAADDTELEFSIGDFNLSDDIPEQETTHVKPKFSSHPVKADYKNAETLADSIQLYPGEQFHCIVNGNFIFGDFIEALILRKDAIVKNMHLSTLSMSQENIDSLEGLLDSGRIEHLSLILSNYFYSHEKHGLIKYLFEHLDKDNRLNVMILRNHTKICLMEISNIRLVLSGSSNLRSSGCVEQFVLQENQGLYDFYKDFFDQNEVYSIMKNHQKEVPHEFTFR